MFHRHVLISTGFMAPEDRYANVLLLIASECCLTTADRCRFRFLKTSTFFSAKLKVCCGQLFLEKNVVKLCAFSTHSVPTQTPVTSCELRLRLVVLILTVLLDCFLGGHSRSPTNTENANTMNPRPISGICSSFTIDISAYQRSLSGCRVRC